MIIEKKLKNGIPVFFDKMDDLQSAAIGVFVKTGTKNETESEHGVSHLLEHMMFKGTTTRTAKQISEEIDDVGGNINAYTSKEVTAYYVKLLAKKLDTGIDILGDLFLNSTFTNENLKKEKKVVIEEINMYEDIPEEKIHDLNSTFVIDGPQSNIVLGTIESVNSIDREILVSYFKKKYIPQNMVISIAGNMDVEAVMSQLEESFGRLIAPTSDQIIDKKNYDMKLNNGNEKYQKEANQVHLCINTIGTSYLDKDKYKYSIISNVLAGNMSSRLFQSIREERGLAYSIYAYMSSFREGGVFTIYAGTTKEDYEEVMRLIYEEFEKIKKDGITEQELKRTKNQFLASLIFGLENSRSRMTRMANTYLSYGKIKNIEETIEEIENITCEDINEITKIMFDKKYYSSTVLGNIN